MGSPSGQNKKKGSSLIHNHRSSSPNVDEIGSTTLSQFQESNNELNNIEQNGDSHSPNSNSNSININTSNSVGHDRSATSSSMSRPSSRNRPTSYAHPTEHDSSTTRQQTLNWTYQELGLSLPSIGKTLPSEIKHYNRNDNNLDRSHKRSTSRSHGHVFHQASSSNVSTADLFANSYTQSSYNKGSVNTNKRRKDVYNDNSDSNSDNISDSDSASDNDRREIFTASPLQSPRSQMPSESLNLGSHFPLHRNSIHNIPNMDVPGSGALLGPKYNFNLSRADQEHSQMRKRSIIQEGDSLDNNGRISDINEDNIENDEFESLLSTNKNEYSNNKFFGFANKILHKAKRNVRKSTCKKLAEQAFVAVPAVILGLTLNLLDAVSYGVIIFPASDEWMPSNSIQSGISLFFASTIISQLVYAMGGSAFYGANGSMMIEVTPFFHMMCKIIENHVLDEYDGDLARKSIIATVVIAYSMSTVLTGITFFTLGYYKLGSLIQFFPRHILIGCIGGIGLFLIKTGLEVTTGITGDIGLDWIITLFTGKYLLLWGSSISLSLLLQSLQRRLSHPLLVPLFYIVVPIIFYITLFASGVKLDSARDAGWLFKLPNAGSGSFFDFYSYFNFSVINWGALSNTIPTQIALAFFGILHVPINVPALAVSTGQDVDLNGELIGHGISNLVAGFAGTTQNYLVYSNSILYMRSGGNSRIGGIMLGLATFAVAFKGSSVVGFVPTIVVGSLIFHLGIDLIKESVWDTRNSGMHKLEYFTILVIVGVMGIVGFTEGIIAGIVLACIFFVAMYSRRSVIRESYSGSVVRSKVHRIGRQMDFLERVGNQIRLISLQGFIFFGTISQLSDYLSHLFEDIQNLNMARFIIFDFSLIAGIDYSAMEAFHNIRKLILNHDAYLIFAGITDESMKRVLIQTGIIQPNHIYEEQENVSPSLSFDELSPLLNPNDDTFSVNENNYDWERFYKDDSGTVKYFASVHEALEWCENKLLMSYFAEKYIRSSYIPGDNKNDDVESNLSSHVTIAIDSQNESRGVDITERPDSSIYSSEVSTYSSNHRKIDSDTSDINFSKSPRRKEVQRIAHMVVREEMQHIPSITSPSVGSIKDSAFIGIKARTPSPSALNSRAGSALSGILKYDINRTSPVKNSKIHVVIDNDHDEEEIEGNVINIEDKKCDYLNDHSLLPVKLAYVASSFPSGANLDPLIAKTFKGAFKRRCVKPGEILWKNGTLPEKIIVIESGQLALLELHDGDLKDDKNSLVQSLIENGKDSLVEVLVPGSVIGAIEVIALRRRACDLVVLAGSNTNINHDSSSDNNVSSSSSILSTKEDDNQCAVIWELDSKTLNELAKANPDAVLKFIREVALVGDWVRWYNFIHHWRVLA